MLENEEVKVFLTSKFKVKMKHFSKEVLIQLSKTNNLIMVLEILNSKISFDTVNEESVVDKICKESTLV